MADEIQGWRPPICYDINLDDKRIVTQDDVDQWQSIVREYGAIISSVKNIIERHERFVVSLKEKKEAGNG